MTITLYTFEGENGGESTYTIFNPREAEEFARSNNMLCFDNEYEFSDRSVAWDFRSDKSDE